MTYNNYNDYNDKVLNIDEIDGSDIKINPDFYIHLGLVNLSKTFDNSVNTKDSFMKYRHIVEHIEVLADAAGLINDDYNKMVKDFKDKDEYKNNKDEVIKSAVLAREKLRLMMKKVFNQRMATDSLKA